MRFEDFPARSPLVARHEGARLVLHGAATAPVVACYPRECAGDGVIDLSNANRWGLRGADAAARLEAWGFSLPERPNHALSQPDGSQVVRLSRLEYLLLGGLDEGAARIAEFAARIGALDAAYPLPRLDSHAWLFLHGEARASVMAKLCGVDMSSKAFSTGAVAQTVVARINAIVVNLPLAGAEGFSLLCDRAAADYLWDVLLDALEEFGGGAQGLSALRPVQ